MALRIANPHDWELSYGHFLFKFLRRLSLFEVGGLGFFLNLEQNSEQKEMSAYSFIF